MHYVYIAPCLNIIRRITRCYTTTNDRSVRRVHSTKKQQTACTGFIINQETRDPLLRVSFHTCLIHARAIPDDISRAYIPHCERRVHQEDWWMKPFQQQQRGDISSSTNFNRIPCSLSVFTLFSLCTRE